MWLHHCLTVAVVLLSSIFKGYAYICVGFPNAMLVSDDPGLAVRKR